MNVSHLEPCYYMRAAFAPNYQLLRLASALADLYVDQMAGSARTANRTPSISDLCFGWLSRQRSKAASLAVLSNSFEYLYQRENDRMS